MAAVLGSDSTEAADQAELDRLAAVGDAALVSPVSNADFSRFSYAYRGELHKARGGRRLRHLLAGFRASLSAAGHVIDAAGIAVVQEALRAEVGALRTGDPDLAAPATFQTLRRNGQVVVTTLVARGRDQRGRLAGHPGRCLLTGCGKLMKIAIN